MGRKIAEPSIQGMKGHPQEEGELVIIYIYVKKWVSKIERPGRPSHLKLYR